MVMSKSDMNDPLVKKMNQHIDEWCLFLRVCEESSVVREDDVDGLWTTWCIRNKETIRSKFLEIAPEQPNKED